MFKSIIIHNEPDRCIVCSLPYAHKRINVRLLSEPLPYVRFNLCHAKCQHKMTAYTLLKNELKELFLAHRCIILDL